MHTKATTHLNKFAVALWAIVVDSKMQLRRNFMQRSERCKDKAEIRFSEAHSSAM